MSIENIVGVKYIYGLSLENNDKFDQYKQIAMNQEKTNKIQRVYYVNKNVLRHQREKIVLVDLVISSNLKPRIQDKMNEGEEDSKALQKKDPITSYQYTNYLVQFISHSSFQNYEVPHVIDKAKWETLLGDEYFDETEQDKDQTYFNNIVNTQFLSSKKQEKYNNYGWKINNINHYIHQPTVYHAV